ncbi:hypothetical protein GCM10023321_50180 [Pseudonocardia eucalypti]|uniref:DUF11 domain-containing protein n=1 Tax=Pseudonocardia eucalypti TaxID=648755 RepID=A0ABP9QK89_9PSEU|nr:hypothetical protein [Pseudonocardia eucalypti]
MKRVIRRKDGWAAGYVAAVVVVTAGLALSSGTAYADNPRPALRVDSLNADPWIAPGGTGKVAYRITNTSGAATQGVLLNISLPKAVSIPQDPRCRNVGANAEGGALISCKVTDQAGKIATGGTVASGNTFTVANNAPAHTKLGRIGLLVVPLDGNGNPTEDYNDTVGANVRWAQVGTR